ncbi:hypothetical protein IG631_11331 [Alternaria alternata]|nr:hypothetical protein IG631_11331 [Alternaria alternata]
MTQFDDSQIGVAARLSQQARLQERNDTMRLLARQCLSPVNRLDKSLPREHRVKAYSKVVLEVEIVVKIQLGDFEPPSRYS